jgi:hypothetical protein
MQIPVPQFLDVEDKIIGPFSLKQFGFIFAGALIILGIFKIFSTGFIFYILSLPVAAIALIFAFAKFNGRKLYNVIPLFIKFLFGDHQYVFQQKKYSGNEILISPITVESLKASTPKEVSIAEPVQSKLRKLSLLLDQKNNEELETLKIIRKQNGER